MKNSYSRLCLKERWTMFTIFLIAGILCAAAAIYAFIKHYMTGEYSFSDIVKALDIYELLRCKAAPTILIISQYKVFV